MSCSKSTRYRLSKAGIFSLVLEREILEWTYIYIYRERKRSGSGKQESLTWQRGSSKAFLGRMRKRRVAFFEREKI
jgi:hypothetical protein